MVTKKDIAEHLGISRTAVSLALNNTPSSTISLETKKKILQAAKELGYRDTEISPKIGFVLYNREANDPRYLEYLQLIEAAASKSDYGLMFISVDSSGESLNKLHKLLDRHEMEGFIITGDADDSLCELLESSSSPYLFLGLLPEVTKYNLNHITIDDRKLTFDAVSHLISLGHSEIALFLGSLDYVIHQKAIQGYTDALEHANIPLDKSLIQVSDGENGYELCKRMQLLKLNFTAAFCANTVIQFGALQRLKDSGISVPKDVSLIGSGLSELGKLSIPPLTTLYVCEMEIEKTVSYLIEIINNPGQHGEVYSFSEFARIEGGTVAVRNLNNNTSN
ncbi:LacI family DNA-binding transcriptional regulator [Paenibacillus eucommiae]|uniref:DNA-binding LacI/PurR family transcriptional regulator n=1 Tax=Paenibacillus eucommiae TaxID=1355755 RepID=A0ABS4J2A0_9BACL|nr:LacI family DNA-binding transcriptional regulator [Paenibacillus eucommiae]MBP1993913.1 DNA-binding LacI/PurR family transcriptional regulator [Paenibacillus eucommiae]